MSIKDELDRASKEKDSFLKQLEEVRSRKLNTLTGLLDESFTSVSTATNSHIAPLKKSITETEVIPSLFDLCYECGLLLPQEHSYSTKITGLIVTRAVEDIYRGKPKWGFYSRPTKGKPRDIVDFYRDLFTVGLPSVMVYPRLEIEHPDTDLSILLDLKKGDCYQSRLEKIHENIDDIDKITDFDLLLQGFQESFRFIKAPFAKNLTFSLTWNYSSEHQRSFYFDEIKVIVSFDSIEISRQEGLTVSIPRNECTKSWVNQQLANVYMKHSGCLHHSEIDPRISFPLPY